MCCHKSQAALCHCEAAAADTRRFNADNGEKIQLYSFCDFLRLFSVFCGQCFTLTTRPCIKVRILPFHSCISAKLFPKESFSFRFRRHCSHLLDCSRRALPATLYPVISARSAVPQSGISQGECSDFPPLQDKNIAQEYLFNITARLYNKNKLWQIAYNPLIFLSCNINCWTRRRS